MFRYIFSHSKKSWINLKNPEPLFCWKYSHDFKTLFGFVLAQKLWFQTQIEWTCQNMKKSFFFRYYFYFDIVAEKYYKTHIDHIQYICSIWGFIKYVIYSFRVIAMTWKEVEVFNALYLYYWHFAVRFT